MVFSMFLPLMLAFIIATIIFFCLVRPYHERKNQEKEIIGEVNREIPPELKRWNWGAFFLNWIWGFAHNVHQSIFMFIPLLNIFVLIDFGLYGNEHAWNNKNWDSVEQFIKVQKLWSYCGFVIFFILVLFALLSNIQNGEVANMKMNDGKYTGEIENGLPHGQGTLYYESGGISS